MELTLLTYSSILVHNAGYAYSGNAHNFTRILKKLASDFSKDTHIIGQEYYAEKQNWDVNFIQWIIGGGKCTRKPAENPHSLYRTIAK